MTDIATVYNSDTGTFDWALENGQLKTDDGLQTAVTLSLFCDARASADDVLPDNSNDRRGWWGNAFPEVRGDEYGSRLWLLGRSKDIPATPENAREYANAACAWLTVDGIATRVEATAERLRSGVLSLVVPIVRPDRTQTTIRFANLWGAL